MKNGKIDKYLFGGGYALASVASTTTDNFAFYYYNQDHLGKYNGKELDKMHGLNTYDYGARQYDPILARWVTT